jgi:hypothetical protein
MLQSLSLPVLPPRLLLIQSPIATSGKAHIAARASTQSWVPDPATPSHFMFINTQLAQRLIAHHQMALIAGKPITGASIDPA